jgi:hypothetical protein
MRLTFFPCPCNPMKDDRDNEEDGASATASSGNPWITCQMAGDFSNVLLSPITSCKLSKA